MIVNLIGLAIGAAIGIAACVPLACVFWRRRINGRGHYPPSGQT